MVGLCPQETVLDNVNVPIYPLLGVTWNTQFYAKDMSMSFQGQINFFFNVGKSHC